MIARRRWAPAALLVACATTAVLAITAAGSFGAHPPADLAGDYLELSSDLDAARSQAMAPGDTVRWQLGLTSRAPTAGELELWGDAVGELAARPGALSVGIRSCQVPWTGAYCARGERTWRDDHGATDLVGATPVTLGSTLLPDRAWIQVSVSVPADLDTGGQALRGTLAVGANAHGVDPATTPPTTTPTPVDPTPRPDDESDQPPDRSSPVPPLARTGAELLTLAALGLASVGTGLTLTGIARRRQEEDR